MSIIYISIGFALFYISVQIIQLFSLYNFKRGKDILSSVSPKVSILLAVRNEEENIIECLEGLNSLNYPKDKLQVLIGDDQSSDTTSDLVLDYIREKDQFIYYRVPENYSPSRGKARVLAFLAKKAKGEFYAITDADISIPKNWLQGLLGYFKDEKIGIVSATSVVGDENSLLGKMQGIDWLYFMGLLKSIDNMGLPSTAIGNNMMIRKDAYWETGGYEKIKFSITEDYKVYEVVTGLGWKCINILTPETLAKAKPVNDLNILLNQRKRWLKGAKDLQVFWWILFTLFTFFFPAVFYLITQNLLLAASMWFVKFLIQNVQITRICNILNYPKFSYIDLIKYEMYLVLMTISTAIYFILPIRTVWKGRTY